MEGKCLEMSGAPAFAEKLKNLEASQELTLFRSSLPTISLSRKSDEALQSLILKKKNPKVMK